jgi:hypothetical protein
MSMDEISFESKTKLFLPVICKFYMIIQNGENKVRGLEFLVISSQHSIKNELRFKRCESYYRSFVDVATNLDTDISEGCYLIILSFILNRLIFIKTAIFGVRCEVRDC